MRAGAVCVIAGLIALSLSGCGAINSFMASTLADVVPEWAGGLPKGAPPRPGDPRDEQFLRDQNEILVRKPEEGVARAAPEMPAR